MQGALCSGLAGYISMWVTAQTNIRVAHAARSSYAEALVICFRGGAFSAVLVLVMCLLGISLLYLAVDLIFVGPGGIAVTDVPLLIVGYGFGASFVALFMQLGGGIYTKAADVGADMVGKVRTHPAPYPAPRPRPTRRATPLDASPHPTHPIPRPQPQQVEQGIPEDDPRNPAVIADLVGDMVGDCVGSSADIFESIAAEIIGAMILGGTLAAEVRGRGGVSGVWGAGQLGGDVGAMAVAAARARIAPPPLQPPPPAHRRRRPRRLRLLPRGGACL